MTTGSRSDYDNKQQVLNKKESNEWCRQLAEEGWDASGARGMRSPATER